MVNDEQKQALLLHTVQEFYFIIVGDDNETFKETVDLLDGYFVPKANVPYERHLFRQSTQGKDKTVGYNNVCSML